MGSGKTTVPIRKPQSGRAVRSSCSSAITSTSLTNLAMLVHPPLTRELQIQIFQGGAGNGVLLHSERLQPSYDLSVGLSVYRISRSVLPIRALEPMATEGSDLLDVAVGKHATAVEYRHGGAEGLGLLHVVGREQNRRALLLQRTH